MTLRITTSILLFLSLLFAPFWISVLITIFGVIYFDFFWESLVLLFISDLLFGVKNATFLHFPFVASVLCIFFILLTQFLKKKLKWQMNQYHD